MVPIPTKPLEVAVKYDPPNPTLIPFVEVKIPELGLKIKFEEVAKSLLYLNISSPLFPGGEIVIVAAIPKGTA